MDTVTKNTYLFAKSCSPTMDSDASVASSAPEAARKIWEDLLLDGDEVSWLGVLDEATGSEDPRRTWLLNIMSFVKINNGFWHLFLILW